MVPFGHQYLVKIALAKLKDSSGIHIINNLLDRKYYDQFEKVDSEEQVQAILVAMQAVKKIPSKKFVKNLLKLATLDFNMKVRDAAIKILDNTYDRKI